MADRVPVKRCAIYVRKSSEEGLDMSYNSLEAQRDACTAYIASQRHEGWVLIQKTYEDGGYSGGNMDRPGLRQLLADVATGKVDIIVVYKIDRLTRSLTDFARLNEVLDQNNVSFVAVTQQFNTSTSMGRLTLNVLLSFAQFEREVAGERIRDKVAASKKKGMWMGGPVPLGYAVRDRRLVIVGEEAEIVRGMFRRYLELRSVNLLQKELEQQGVRSRTRLHKDGHSRGGLVLGRGAIAHMLKNPLYAGQIPYKNELHQGQHEAIIAREHFDAVQAALAEQAPGEGARIKRPAGALLKGMLFDGNGSRMQPTYSNKNGVRYQYYTSSRRLRSASDDPDGIRVPAGDLERLVTTAIAGRLKDGKRMQQWLATRTSPSDLPALLKRCADLAAHVSCGYQTGSPKAVELIEKVVVSKRAVEVVISSTRLQREFGIDAIPPDQGISGREDVNHIRDDLERGRDGDADVLRVVITSHLLRCGKQVKLVLGHAPDGSQKSNSQLIEMISRARRWYEGLTSGRYPTLRSIAWEEQCDKSYVSRLLSVAFLAPDIVERMLTGDHPATLTPERLRKACPLPPRWDEQRAMLLD
jgi:DNA invertase Pin-like site-specific DNA recombinase